MTNEKRISTDGDIRTALRTRLMMRYSVRDDVVVVDELPVCRGTVRTDIAIITNQVEGIEIKSEADNLNRLPRQVKYFDEALNRATLVAAPRHLESALHIVPNWWAVSCGEIGARGGITFRRVRAGKANPGRTVEGVAGLLERDELVSVLTRLGQGRGWRSKPSFSLVAHIAKTLTLEQISAGACDQLKLRAYLEHRYAETAFGRSVFGGAITVMSEKDENRTAQSNASRERQEWIKALGDSNPPEMMEVIGRAILTAINN